MVVFDGPANTVCEDYLANRVGADLKYKGKAVRVKVLVDKIGRTRSDAAFVGHSSVYNPSRAVEPNIIFVFPAEREGSIAELKPGAVATIEGVCAGRKDDGVDRGLQGYDFHVRVEDCRLVGVESGASKKASQR